LSGNSSNIIMETTKPYFYFLLILLSVWFTGCPSTPEKPSIRVLDTNLYIQSFHWTRKAGGSSSGLSENSGICIDGEGFTYVTGSFYGTETFETVELKSSGKDDVFIAKYNSSGKLVWIKQAGGTKMDGGGDICSDKKGNIYVTGVIEGRSVFDKYKLKCKGKTDVFIAKYDKNGNVLWAKSIGGRGTDKGTGIVVDKDGNSYIAGHFTGSVKFGRKWLKSRGKSDIFLVKLDKKGKVSWAKKAGGKKNDYNFDIGIDALANVYITGSFEKTAKFEKKNIKSKGLEDIYLAKYNTEGKLIFVFNGGGDDRDMGYGIDIDEKGDVYLTGGMSGIVDIAGMPLTSSGSFDIFIVKLDKNGEGIWATKAGGPGIDIAYGICTDKKGNAFITGGFDGSAAFGKDTLNSIGETDVFVTKFGNDGTCLWSINAGDSKTDIGYGIDIGTDNRLSVIGYFSGSITFGSESLSSSTQSMFIVCIDDGLICRFEKIPLNP